MSVMAVGAWELILLMGMLSGGQGTDLLALVQPEEYFKARGLDMTVAKMAELAGKEPTDGKSQVAQLLALRALAEEPAEVKADKNFAAILRLVEQIAEGKTAQDSLGFSKEYAGRTLARLTGKEAPTIPMPKDSIRGEAFRYFPAAVSLLGAVDFRGGYAPSSKDDPIKALRDLLKKMAPAEVRSKIYDVADDIGNIRMERVAFGFVDAPPNQRGGSFFIRVTGKLDQKRLAAYLKAKQADVSLRNEKIGQENLLFLEAKGNPGLVFLGNTDLLLAAQPGVQGGPEALLAQALATGAGKEKNALDGSLKAALAKLDSKAAGTLLGSLPLEMRQGLGQALKMPMPTSLWTEMKHQARGLGIHLEASLDNADDAKAFKEVLTKGVALGKEMLAKIPPQAQIPASVVEAFSKALDSVQLDAQANQAKVNVVLPSEMSLGLPALMLVGMRTYSELGPVPPPQPQVQPAKKQ